MLRFTPGGLLPGLLAIALATSCGSTTAGPVERPSVPPLALSLSNQDGFIDRSGAFGFFNSAAEGFEVGDGGEGDSDAFVFRISVVNQSSFPISDLSVTDEIAPRGGIAVCREILASSPDGADNPSIGFVAEGDCATDGFVWEIGTLNAGELAELHFRAEAIAEGADVNRVTLDAESVTEFVLWEEPFFVGQPGTTTELDLSVEDGFIDRLPTTSVFDAAQEAFVVGDGSATRPDALIYQIIVTNQSAVAADDLQIVNAVGPNGHGIACREIISTAPDGFANPTLGEVSGGTCAFAGFTWRIGTLEGGTTAILYFRAEALEEGNWVNLAGLLGPGLKSPALLEEPTAVFAD